MFMTLLAKEVRNAVLTFRFGVAFVSILVLTLASFWVQADDFQRRLTNYNLTAEKDAVADREVYLPSQVTPTVHRAPSALSIFAQGENRRYGDMVTLYRWYVPREASGSFSNNNLMAALPNFDFLQITIIVISLFGVMLGFDGVSGEREKETLRLMCASPVGRRTMYAAKFFGGAIVLALPILVAFLGGLLYLTLVQSIPFIGGQWGAMALMAFTAVVYGSLFVAAGLLCSTLFRRSSVSLVFSLGLWLFGSIAIPVLAKSIAEYLEPLPSPSELSNIEASSLRDAAAAYREFTQRYPQHPWGADTGGYGVSNGLYNGTIKFDGSEVEFREAEEYIRFMENYMMRRADQVWDAYRKIKQQSERQAQVASLLAAFSPAHHARAIFTALADTGYRSYEDFLENARRSRRAMLQGFSRKGYFSDNALEFFSRRPREEINDELKEQRYAKYESGELELGQEAWGYLPENDIPRYPDIAPEPAFGAASVNFAALLIAAALLLLAGVFAFNRYDVR